MKAEKGNCKANESRRSNKPLMEKRRRARINQSLTELKALILDAVKKDTSRHNKLEKADILEMTVKYLQNLQRQQMAVRITTDPAVANKFRAGFGECASEVTRFLDRAEGLEPAVRDRLSSHLSTCLSGIDTKRETNSESTPAATATQVSVVVSSTSSVDVSPLHSPAASSAPVSPAPSTATSSADRSVLSCADLAAALKAPVFSGLQLIPTRLANGEIAFILPTQRALAAAHVLASQATPSASIEANLPVTAAKFVPDNLANDQTAKGNTGPCSEKSTNCCHEAGRDAESPPMEHDLHNFNLPGNQSNGMLFIKEEGVWRPW